MDIVFAMILSIAIKGISAVFEIAIQMLMTNRLGVSEYGNYTFFVSLVGSAYFIFFSGSIKLNTFYLSTPTLSLSEFKKKYNLYYVTPIIAVIVITFAILQRPYGVLVGLILCMYYYAYDYSSIFLSRGYQLPALLGEYLLGRIALLVSLLIVLKLNIAKGLLLFGLYGIQFVTMLFWFALHRSILKPGTNEIKVPMRKLLEYQISDVANSLISYSPTILQFIIGGAFTAGFTGIIAIVKRFIGFISGPTAKIFLPEFSRLYKSGDRDKLEQSYLMTVRIQMIFIGTIGAILIGFPRLILHTFNPALEQYSSIFIGTAISLLIISGIGPVTGMLQMTGNESICNRNQWISIGIMIIVWVIMRQEPLFAVYGLCAQTVSEGCMKYFSVCRWFGKNILPIKNYFILWLPVIVFYFAIEEFCFQYSYVALMICVLFAFFWNLYFAMQDPMVQTAIRNNFQRFRKK